MLIQEKSEKTVRNGLENQNILGMAVVESSCKRQ